MIIVDVLNGVAKICMFVWKSTHTHVHLIGGWIVIFVIIGPGGVTREGGKLLNWKVRVVPIPLFISQSKLFFFFLNEEIPSFTHYICM